MTGQRVQNEKDYYQVLGVPQSATAKEITKAYRKLARESHPDTHPDDPEAEDRFKEIGAAYDTLGDKVKRAEYDEARRQRTLGGIRFTFGNANGFTRDDHGGGAGSTLGDLLSALFDRGTPRGDDIHLAVAVPLADIVAPSARRATYVARTTCSTCDGFGTSDGTAPTACSTCTGTGRTDRMMGANCRSCQGTGTAIASPCAACAGSGSVETQRDITFTLPAGVDDGQVLLLRGQGHTGPRAGQVGDVYIHCSVVAHPRFERSGPNLYTSVAVPFDTLVLGGQVDVVLLDGTPTTIHIRSGTQGGTRIRITGAGLPKNGTAHTGDLIVTVAVEVPATVSDTQRAALEAFGEASGRARGTFHGTSPASSATAA